MTPVFRDGNNSRYSKKPYYTKQRQLRLYYSGRSFFARIGDWEPPKYTKQKKFKKGKVIRKRKIKFS